MKKRRFSAREQRNVLLIVLSGFLTCYVYVVYIVRPLLRESDKLSHQMQTAQTQLAGLERATANEAALRAQYEKVQETVAALQQRLPSEEQLPMMIERLSDLASQAQVKIQSIFPQRPSERDSGSAEKGKGDTGPVVYTDVTIQIDAVAGYHQVGTFLSLIEAEDRPLRLSSLRLSADPKSSRLRIRLLVQAYFTVSDDQDDQTPSQAHRPRARPSASTGSGSWSG